MTVAAKTGDNWRFGLYDAQGAEVTGTQWRTLGTSANSNWNPGRYDSNRARISAPQFSEGKIKVQNTDGKWGFLDRAGQTVGTVTWDEIGDFSEGLAVVAWNGKYGYITQEGGIKIGPAYSAAGPFCEGLAAVQVDGRYQYIDADNQVVIQPLYTRATSFTDGKADVYREGTGWQVIDKTGRLEYFIPAGFKTAYTKAEALLAEGKYMEAYAVYAALKGYEDADYKMDVALHKQADADYSAAEMLREEGQFEQARAVFEALGDFEDAATQILATWYAEGEAKRIAQEWDGAVKAFQQASQYEDAATQVFATRYAEGEAKRATQDWDGAVKAFQQADQYEDAAAQVFTTRYAEGEAKRIAQDWDGAVKAFEQSGNYSDAETQIKETRYQQAAVLMNNGDYLGAYRLYTAISGYKDVESIVETDANLIAAVAAAEHQAKLKPFKTVGGYVTFGIYPQTNAGNDETAIEWQVLDVQGNKALLISRYGLDAKPYNEKWDDITWEKCTMRTWLNNDFMNKAFNSAEQSAILLTNVDNSKSQGYRGWSTNGGNNTQDNIFLLSYAEANKYFGVTEDNSNNTKSRVVPTAYAIKQGAYASSSNKMAEGQATGWWWLRSPGDTQDSAALVSTDDTLGRNYVSRGSGVVRPALWINLESDIF